MQLNNYISVCLSLVILDIQHVYADGNNKCSLIQTETDYSAGIPQDVFPHCRCNTTTLKCFTEITWKPPLPGKQRHNVTGYRLNFMDSGRRVACYLLPSNATSFIFDNAKCFNQNCQTTTFTVIAQPVKGGPSTTATYLQCPKDVELWDDVSGSTVNSSQKHIFKIDYVGNPEPVVTWRFSKDIIGCKNLTTLTNHGAVKISNGITNGKKDNKYSSTLEISKVTKAHQGCYAFHIHNYFSCFKDFHPDFHDSYCNTRGILMVNDVDIPRSKRILGAVLGGVAGGLLFVVIIAFIVYKYLYWDKRSFPVNCPEQILYMSHCAVDEKEKEKLLKFASSLQLKLSGVTVVTDITCQNEINECGGMPQWVPEQMQKAKRILVVLSDKYVEMLKSDEKDDITRKIHAECNQIENYIYESCQSNEKCGQCLATPPRHHCTRDVMSMRSGQALSVQSNSV
jgi:hypothetical protein